MNLDRELFIIALSFYLIALLFYGIYLVKNKEIWSKGWLALMGIGFFIHSIEMIRQAFHLVQTGGIHLFEVLVLFSWGLAGLSLILQTQLRMRILLGVVLLLVFVIGGAALGIPRSLEKTIPALNTFWLAAHILLSLLGYAAFCVGLISSIFYLILDRQLKMKISGPLFQRLPPLEVLEFINFRSLWAGTLFLGLGLLSGFLWAKWSKNISLTIADPKVISAWATFFIYGGILYVRSTARLRGRKVAYLTIFGFACVLITFFLMNYVSKGHGFF